MLQKKDTEVPESELRSVLEKYFNECMELQKKLKKVEQERDDAKAQLKTVEQERDDANEPSPLDGLY